MVADNASVAADRISLTYRVVMTLAGPIVRWWGRAEIVGADLIPADGAVVLFGNHDSMWDPVIIGVAGMPRRQVRALAKSSLWKFKPVAWVLDRMGQIPIERGRGDTQALATAISHLEAGECVGVFPEGTTSRGAPVRALSGAGRLALAVPSAHVLCVALTGAVDIVRFPKRPRIRVEFFEPEGGQPAEGESAVALTKRVMTQVRGLAPYAVPGRRKTAHRYEQAARDREAAS